MTTISDQCRSVAPHMESQVMVVPHMVPVRMDRGPRTGRPRMGRVARNTVVRPRAAHHPCTAPARNVRMQEQDRAPHMVLYTVRTAPASPAENPARSLLDESSRKPNLWT